MKAVSAFNGFHFFLLLSILKSTLTFAFLPKKIPQEGSGQTFLFIPLLIFEFRINLMLSTKHICLLLLLTIFSTYSITLTHECKVDKSKNYVCNGDFEQPVNVKSPYEYFDTIPCWTSTRGINLRFKLLRQTYKVGMFLI